MGKTETLGSLYSNALLILTYTSKSKNQMVHEQKFKDPLNSTCQISPERIVLDLESGVRGLCSIPLGVTFFKIYNRNLHNIANSDRIRFMTKTSNNQISTFRNVKVCPWCGVGLLFSCLFFTRSAASCKNNAPLWFGRLPLNLKVREVKCIPGDPTTMCPLLFKGSRSLLLFA